MAVYDAAYCFYFPSSLLLHCFIAPSSHCFDFATDFDIYFLFSFLLLILFSPYYYAFFRVSSCFLISLLITPSLIYLRHWCATWRAFSSIISPLRSPFHRFITVFSCSSFTSYITTLLSYIRLLLLTGLMEFGIAIYLINIGHFSFISHLPLPIDDWLYLSIDDRNMPPPTRHADIYALCRYASFILHGCRLYALHLALHYWYSHFCHLSLS